MKRPWQVWLVFVVCVVGAGSAMAWLTRQALHADELRRAAESEAKVEQRVSLALWRMDTELAPIIAAEVVRPASAYRPGPTAIELPPFVLLQFEAGDDGDWRTPQQPTTSSRELPRLIELREAVNVAQLIAELPAAPLPTIVEADRSAAPSYGIAENGAADENDSRQFFSDNTMNRPPNDVQSESPFDSPPEQSSKVIDFLQRGKRYQTAAEQNLMNSQQQARQVAMPGGEALPSEQVGISRPVWIGDRLILARRASDNGNTIVQGSWLDWPRLKERLLAEVSELLPGADLVRAEVSTSDDPSRMLAGLPVRLVVNESDPIGAVGPTLGWALWIGWGAVALAVSAAAALLHGVMTLSERRAAFVSSVTHELRTPLTTFRMYAEMLARGMVPDAARRQEYFETLQHESERLTLLVENVLAYARLERGRKPQGQDRLSLTTLLDRIGPRLAQRAAQADMKCVMSIDDLPLPMREGRGKSGLRTGGAPSPCPLPEGEGNWKAGEPDFCTDQSVVEQILFNLVDNAAKYARGAEDPRIHIEASRNRAWVRIAVRDHGPGIEQRAWGRPPRAFGKTAEQSAETAPGVGLGLALCRRLALQLGGRLEIGGANGNGANVTLLLPR